MLLRTWFSLLLLLVLVKIVQATPLASNSLSLLGPKLQLHGTIIAQPCVISSEPVNMGAVNIRDLYINSVSDMVSFSIKLANCKPNLFNTAKVTFDKGGAQRSDGLLTFTDGEASGAGIRLFDAFQHQLPLGSPSSGYTLNNNLSEHDLLFYARVEGYPEALNSNSIQPGKYSVIVFFIVSYE